MGAASARDAAQLMVDGGDYVTADEAKEIERVHKALIDAIYRNETTTMHRHKGLRLTSQPGEDAAAFRRRVEQTVDERIAEKANDLKQRMDRKADTLQDKLERKAQQVDQAQAKVRTQQTREIVNVGETLFGMFFGGRKKSLSTAMSRRSQTAAAGQRVSSLEMELQQIHGELAELQTEMAEELADIQRSERAALDDIESEEVGLEKNDIDVESVGIVWVGVG